jgi:glyoxylase-like metal-dependent hydrolase (beta-lactamase superfamily II)
VERGSERIAYVSDLIPTPHHLPLPYIPALDENPNETLAQKRELLDMAIRGGWLVIFGHGHEQRAGYVQARNGRPRLLPVEI